MNQGKQMSPSTNSIQTILIIVISMNEYKQLLKMLFNSWARTHQLSARIVDQQIRRNNIKRLEGNYRRFQHQITYHFKPEQEIDHGLIRYHHHLAQTQYRMILKYNHKLSSKCLKLNPYPRREENFEINRNHKSKINLMNFLGQ